MATSKKEDNESLQIRTEALQNEIDNTKDKIEDLSQAIQDTVSEIENINKEKEDIFGKYTGDVQKTYGKQYTEKDTPTTKKELQNILIGLQDTLEELKNDSSSSDEEIFNIENIIEELKNDIDKITFLEFQKRQANKEKKGNNDQLNIENAELVRFREALRNLTDDKNNSLKKIEKNTDEIKENSSEILSAIYTLAGQEDDDEDDDDDDIIEEDDEEDDEAIEENSEATEENTETLEENNEATEENTDALEENTEEVKAQKTIFQEISEKLSDILSLLPDLNADKEGTGKDTDDDSEDGDDDIDREERISDLQDEASIVEEIKKQLSEITDIVTDKNALFEEEGKLIEDEALTAEKLKDTLGGVKDIASGITDELGGGAEAVRKMNDEASKTGNLFKGLGGIFNGFLGVFDLANSRWNEINHQAITYGRQLGMNAQQMRLYNKLLMSSETTSLMRDFNLTHGEITKLQEGLTEATGKAIILGKESMSAMAATSKFVGGDIATSMAEQFDELGGSIQTSQEYLAATMERARASGLDMVKHSRNFANNIKLASKFNFKNGLSDISKMTALTDRWKINLSNVVSGLHNSFKDIETSIETAAKIQVLGGSMAGTFSNPLEMMNLAYTDMGKMVEKFKETIKDVGIFNEKSGMVEINSFRKRILEEQASALNLNFDEILNAVNKEGQATAIQSQIISRNLEENQKEWILNNAQFDEQRKKWYVTHINEKGYTEKVDVDKIGNTDDAKANPKNFINVDVLRATSSGEEKLQSNVQEIRNYLLNGKIKEEASDNAVSSYNEIKSVVKDAFEVDLTDMVDPLEQVKLQTCVIIKNAIPQVLSYVKEFAKMIQPATWWNNSMDYLGRFLPTNALKIGSGATSTIDGASGSIVALASVSAALWGLSKGLKALPSLLWKGGKLLVTGIFKLITAPFKLLANGIKGLGNLMAKPFKWIGSKFSSGGATATPRPTSTPTPSGAGGSSSGGASSSFRMLSKPTSWRNALSRSAKGLKVGGAVAGVLAAFEIGNNAKNAMQERNAIKQKYGIDNLDARMRDRQSFYNEVKEERTVREKENEANNKALGGAIGATIGGAIGSVVGPLGTVVGGIAGEWLGRKAAPAVGKAKDYLFGKSENSQKSISELAQDKFEHTKIGLKNIKTKDQLFEQAALATIGIHDLLISQSNEKKGKLSSGKEKNRGAVGNTIHSVKEGVKSLFGFSQGGIVSEPQEQLEDANGDVALAKVAPKEMVLTESQQARLFSIINGEETITKSRNVANSRNNSIFRNIFTDNTSTMKGVVLGGILGPLGAITSGIIGQVIDKKTKERNNRTNDESITSAINRLTSDVIINRSSILNDNYTNRASQKNSLVIDKFTSLDKNVSFGNYSDLYSREDNLVKSSYLLNSLRKDSSDIWKRSDISNLSSNNSFDGKHLILDINSNFSKFLSSSFYESILNDLKNKEESSKENNNINNVAFSSNFQERIAKESINSLGLNRSSDISSRESLEQTQRISKFSNYDKRSNEIDVSKNALYDKPTIIKSFNELRNSSFSENIGRNSLSGNLNIPPVNINLNGTLKLDGGQGQVGKIDVNQLLNNTEFVKMLAEAIDKNTRTVFNGGAYNGEHSRWKLSKV